MAFKTNAFQGQRPLAEEMEEARNSLLNSARQQQFDAVLNMARSSVSGGSSTVGLPLQADPIPGRINEKPAFPSNFEASAMETPNSLEGLAASVFLQAMAHSSGGMVLRAYEMAGRAGNIHLVGGQSETRTASLESSISSRVKDRSMEIPRANENERLGNLSAEFESADAGAGAIGYDRNGGTSYGIFQISSRQGTMKLFLNFLDKHAPQWAARLKTAGPADTGSTQGSMPREWSRIAQEDPVCFEKLQEDFIKESHYNAALDEIRQKTGLDLNVQSVALQQVVWSTAVQHGPHGAANVFNDAVERIKSSGKEFTEKQLIENVYTLRASKFGLSTPQVRAAVQARFKQEKGMALAMLDEDRSMGQG